MSRTAINLYRRLRSLQPDPPLLTGVVDADLGGGSFRVVLNGGGILVVRNPFAIAVGKEVFVQGSEIKGEAPALRYALYEI